MRRSALALAIVIAVGGIASARAASKAAAKTKTHKAKSAKAKPAKAKPEKPSAEAKECMAELDKLNVSYKKAGPHKGIDIPIQVTGPLGGITYKTWEKRRLVLDCSLVYSLAKAGSYFTDAGYTTAFYSSAYQRRNVKGTNRPSNHSYGLALDVHSWTAKDQAELAVKDSFEMGLGDETDCIGAPQTEEGKTLKTFWCRLDRSGMFRFILNPDTDADHWNHYHIEVLHWQDRTDVGTHTLEQAKKAARKKSHESE